jgi:PadR family transcriptional regulator AphA
MSLRYALLGLLREGPASGYDLLQIFKLSLSNTWPATQSQVYTELGKLADAGLLSVSEQGARGRKEYRLTEEGLAELRRWLLETKPERQPRSEAMVRVFLLGAVERGQAVDYLTWLAEDAAKRVAGFERIPEAPSEWSEKDLSVYGHYALEYGKRFWQMNREWALWAAEQTRLRGEAEPEGVGDDEYVAEAAAESGNEETAKERGGEKDRPNQKA